jgi:uncharacterized alkaline shock family protein YloU
MTDKLLKSDIRRQVDIKKVDTKEFEFPETHFISDIDTRVIQGIVLQSLSKVEGVALAESNFIDNIFGRGGPEIASGIHSEQDNATHSVSIKIEINIRYGICIPEKAEEIQSKVVEEITRLTGLRVSSIHVVFKGIISPNQALNMTQLTKQSPQIDDEQDDYSDDF